MIIIRQLSKQKFIFKIHSTRIKNSKWNLNLSISDARKNDEIITMSDSEIFRFINIINGIDQKEKDGRIANIKNQIKRIKKMESSRENGKKINNLYNELYDLQFVPDYVCVIIDKKSDFRRANKGFFINGLKYKRLVGTPNGVKNSTIVYVNETSMQGKPVLESLKNRIDNGRDMTKEMVPAKFEAYKSLVCSSSIPVSNPRGVLVVNDCETTFLSDYIELNDADSEFPIMKYVENGNVELVDSDGYGLMLPELSKQWAVDIGENTGDESDDTFLSGCCIRNSFCKGMCFCFDFKKFADKIAKKETVTDVWGQTHNIKDIDLILTASMLKLWSSYKSIDDYLENCNKNQYNFGITKTCPSTLENQRSLNYQFLQSYELTDQQIDELIKPTIDEIKAVLGMDINKSILFLKGVFLNENNVEHIESDFIKALMIDDRMINDPFVRSKIYQMIKKRITDAKIGVLKVHGNYSIVSGDPYSLCQSIFGMEVTGLLKAGQTYSEYWNDRCVDKVVCFRAPMTCHNNIRILRLSNTKEMRYWYKYMKTITIFNSWDTAAHALNGLDKDGDSVLTSDSKILVDNTKELPAILCIQKRAASKTISEDDLVRANVDSFGDEIGTTTNRITSMFDVQAKYEKDSKEYTEIDYRIKCGQLFQQNCIDRTKGIVAKPMPKSWYGRAENKIHPTDNQVTVDIKKFNMNILADKKPYFMNYIYPQQMSMYKKYIENTNKKCLMEFRLDINSLIEKPNKTKRELEFLEYYHSLMPVGMNNCLLNRICWKVENIFDQYLKQHPPSSEFDYSILKGGSMYDKKSYDKISQKYSEYLKLQQMHQQHVNKKRMDASDISMQRNIFKQQFKKDCLKICSNEDELCNIVLDMCYRNNNSKQFAWDICGDVIVRNLLNINDNKIKCVYQDDFGDIEFGGRKFSVLYKKIGDDCLSE